MITLRFLHAAYEPIGYRSNAVVWQCRATGAQAGFYTAKKDFLTAGWDEPIRLLLVDTKEQS